MVTLVRFAVCFVLFIAYAHSFRPHLSSQSIGKHHSRIFGFFDDMKKIYSKENQDAIKAENEAQKMEMLKAQKEILERRNNPKSMREYEEKKDTDRRKLAEERATYSFQNKVQEGYDPLTDWKRLREEGKIKIGKDLDRSQGKVLGAKDGLIEVRVDERMPYIDQGYVDEESDVMGKFMSIFGRKKK